MRQRRVRDWPERLAAFVESRRTSNFIWGENDCVLFAADCVLELTGRDIVAKHRGTYHNANQAARALAAVGGFHGLLASPECGLELIPVAMAGRGDIVLVENDGRPGLCVVLDYRCVGPWESGISFVPISQAMAAWRV